MPTRLVFTGKQQVEYEEFVRPALSPHQVRIQTICSLMSTGTENICFNRLFAPGTHWDRWVKYPFYPGYLIVGRIIEVGTEVTRWKTGDLVGSRLGHSSEVVDQDHKVLPMPEGVDPEQLAWFGLAKIGFMGTKAAAYHLGDSLLMIGAGPVAQIAIRWAAACGVEHLIVVDSIPMRLEMAKRGGATHTLGLGVEDCEAAILDILGDELPKIVMDSTGNAKVLPLALPLVQRQGKLVILGDTGDPSEQRLTPDVVTRGVTIVGAHDGLEEGEWTAERIHRLFVSLLQSGRLNLKGLTTHRFHPKDCADAYTLANTKRGETMGIVFDWSQVNG